MSKKHHTVLAGIAALALFAGAGIASAQQSQDQNGKMQGMQGQQPQTTQPMNKGAAVTTGKKHAAHMGAQRAKAGKTVERARMSHNGTAMREHHRRMTAAEQNRSHRLNGAQQGSNGQQNFGQQNFGQAPRSGFEGLQGNAAAGNVQLSDDQRTQIRNTVLSAPNAPRVGNVDFPVVTGTVVPRGSVQVMPVPPTLARIQPAWRGFRYFVWNNQLVIVNPRDMRIVAIVYV